MLALPRLCIVVSVMDTSANERGNDQADNNLHDGSSDGKKSKLHPCAHHIANIWCFNSCYEWIHDEGSLESCDAGVCSYFADSVGLLLRWDPARFKCTGHSLESLVREMDSLVADLLRLAVSHSAYIVGFPLSLELSCSCLSTLLLTQSCRCGFLIPLVIVSHSACDCVGQVVCEANLEGLGIVLVALKKV